MIDIHCHLLPNIDDGSSSLEQSVAVLREFARAGVTDVVLTPHLSASVMVADGDAAVSVRERAFEGLRRVAPDRPRLTEGFEIMLDQPMPTLALGDTRFSLAGSRYYLVEFPLTVVPRFANTVLQQMARAGTIPIVAHPERYDACSPAAVGEWRQAGARIQVDATTLTRPHARGRKARALLAAGVVDLVAADNHGDYRSLRTAADFLSARGCGPAVVRLTDENPRAVIENGLMREVGSAVAREGWVEKVSRLLGR